MLLRSTISPGVGQLLVCQKLDRGPLLVCQYWTMGPLLVRQYWTGSTFSPLILDQVHYWSANTYGSREGPFQTSISREISILTSFYISIVPPFQNSVFPLTGTTISIMLCLLKTMCIPSFILIGCCVSELQDNLCPYCNVWPEAVYHCFTRTTLFT